MNLENNTIDNVINWSFIENEGPYLIRYDKNHFSLWIHYNEKGEIIDISGNIPSYIKNKIKPFIPDNLLYLLKEL